MLEKNLNISVSIINLCINNFNIIIKNINTKAESHVTLNNYNFFK